MDKVDRLDVEEKFLSMAEDNEDLVKMTLLYFIGYIIIRRKNKGKGLLDPFFLKLVNHLDLCQTFPWDTLSFKYCLDILADKMKEPSERSKPSLNSWNLHCFITLLEIFPFECIANLKSKYRLPVRGAVNTCPRMCKMEFRKTGEKGFSLNGIYISLGTDKDIKSILVPTIDEHHLVAEVQEPETDHSTINNWKLVLMKQKKICWDHLYEKDQSNRVVEVKENTRERNGDNLETNLERSGVELLKKKSDQQGKAIFDLRAQLEALKGQPRDDPQPQYSSPFQPDNETQPQYSSFHQNEEEEENIYSIV
ncbi:hypothetical protein IGI04_006377 [Brassica rapa subsp. trilocularis]|uniref:DUF287 domain-containing protein n=1 Tax=Brassica rapa subsp. trilocularis TaxID=1813537 RepID=A0ABQ7NGP0_BRACM|nr:hypothetical protein IGI04_006377 [Brassica rapa subsp. trilocularis]